MRSQVAINLDDLADGLHGVKWHRNYLAARCPFHDDTHASLLVYEDGYFKCLSCGAYGNHAKLQRKLQGEKYRPPVTETKSATPPWLYWKEKYSTYEEAAKQAYNNAKAFPALLSYLKQRKLDNFIQQGKFGWLDGWLSFPVFDQDGDFVDWVIRSHPSKKTDLRYAIRPRKNRTTDNHLYSPDWEFCQKSQEIYFPFGILDAWSIFACSLPAVTGITGQLVQAELLDDIRKTIYIIPDRDEINGAIRLQERLDWRGRILRLNYPDGCKDSNDVLRLHGVNHLREIIEEAKHGLVSS